MFWTKVVFLISTVFAYRASAYAVNTIKKCKLRGDDKCQSDLYRKTILESAEVGIPEMGIPANDPFEIKNMDVVGLGFLKIAMLEGVARGFKSCKSNSFRNNFDTLIVSVDLSCEEFSLEGHYEISTTPALDAIIGGIKLHGEGKGGVVLKKTQLNIEMPYKIKKLEDGELHAVIDRDGVTYDYKILDKIIFTGDNLSIGSQDISVPAVNILNENWEFVSRTFGRAIFDKIMDVFVTYTNKFFVAVPLKDLTTDDVSSLPSS